MEQFHLGIDVGATKTKAAILTNHYNVVVKCSSPSPKLPNADMLSDYLINLIEELLCKAGNNSHDIASIGIGLPGMVNNTHIYYLPNFALRNADIQTKIHSHFGTDVYIDNDGNINTIAEAVMGAGKGYTELILLTLGTGLGGGVISNGRLIRGYSNLSGEFGHMILDVHGPLCSCGKYGCFESFCSAKGLLNHAHGLITNNKGISINMPKGMDLSTQDVTALFEGYKNGNMLCIKVIKRFIKYLSYGIVNLVNIFNPQLIILGGGISNASDLFLQPVSEQVSARLMHPAQKVLLKVAELGADAGIFGAALLHQQLF